MTKPLKKRPEMISSGPKLNPLEVIQSVKNAKLEVHPQAASAFHKIGLPLPLRRQTLRKNFKIDLASNTNPYGGRWSRYSDLDQEEIKGLYLQNLYALNHRLNPRLKAPSLSLQNLTFTVGSIEGIDIIQRAFAEPKQDTICVTVPSFEAYQHWGMINNLKIAKVPLQGDQFEDMDLSEVKKINPKILFLCDPNNPTSTQLRPGLIEEACEALQGLVVVDEAYIEFSNRPSLIQKLEDFKNLVILRTLSKGWGMAGARCGAVLAGDPRIIQTLRCVQIPYGFSGISQEFVKKNLQNLDRFIQNRDKIIQTRTQFIRDLKKIQKVKKIFNSQTNFVCLVLEEPSFEETLNRIYKENILVENSSKTIPHSLRISISKPGYHQKVLRILR